MDLNAQLTLARRQVDGVLASSGTVLDVVRPDRDLAGDGAGAAVLTRVASGVAGMLLPAGEESLPLSLAGTAPVEPGTVVALLGVGVDVAVGDVLTVTRCRDPRMTGAAYLVQALESSSAGVVRRARAVAISGPDAHGGTRA